MTQEELKATTIYDAYWKANSTGEGTGIRVYLKSEADKVIAELEESHKMEVEQLLIEIAELKDKALQYKVLYKEKCRDINTQERFFAAERAHNKYKRCLAMAQEWRNYAAFCGMQSHCHNHRGFGKTADKWTWKECHAWRCVKRWLELAEKFKEKY